MIEHALTALQTVSVKTRVTLFTLAVFLLGIWSIAYYASGILRERMEQQVGEQLYSTASLLAKDIDEALVDRLNALDLVAKSIPESTLGNTDALNSLLEQRPILQQLFNAGVFVVGFDGVAIADVPRSGNRLGVNYSDRDFVLGALKEGKATVGQPVIGRVLKTPLFSMSVPIRNARGNIIGALMGTIELGKPSFLGKVTDSKYGKTGGYILFSKSMRMSITATDKRFIMRPLPAPGVNPLVDRYLDGFEGYGTTVDSNGLHVFSSAKRISVTDWMLTCRIPAEEALAPINAVQHKLLLATILFTLVAGCLIWMITWYMLRRQLSPMLKLTQAIDTWSATKQRPQALPVTSQDEIGELVGGFNHLLGSLMQREDDLLLSRAELNEAQRIAHLGNWTVNVPEDKLIWSDELFRLLEIDPDPGGTSHADYRNTIHPEDRDAVDVAHTESATRGTRGEISYRLRMRDGRIKWVQEHFIYELDAAGRLLRSRGTVQEVTERKRAEGELTVKMAELERFNRAMVGRELQMIKLKQEINALCQAAGMPVRYTVKTADQLLEADATKSGVVHAEGAAP